MRGDGNICVYAYICNLRIPKYFDHIGCSMYNSCLAIDF